MANARGRRTQERAAKRTEVNKLKPTDAEKKLAQKAMKEALRRSTGQS